MSFPSRPLSVNLILENNFWVLSFYPFAFPRTGNNYPHKYTNILDYYEDVKVFVCNLFVLLMLSNKKKIIAQNICFFKSRQEYWKLLIRCLGWMNNLLKAERHQRASSSQIFPSSLINFYIRRIFFSIISPLSFINTYFSTTTFTLKWNAALLRFLDFKKSLLIKQGRSQSRFGNISPILTFLTQ